MSAETSAFAYANTQILQMLSQHPLPELKAAADELSQNYRALEFHKSRHPLFHLAYLAVRFPATFEVNHKILSVIPNPQDIASFLDLGAGPGTASVAAQDTFPDLNEMTLIDSDGQFQKIARTLLESRKTKLNFEQGLIHRLKGPYTSDVVSMSYVLGELDEGAQDALIQEAWTWAQKYLILIEPGTPRGYGRILRAREHLLAKGAHILGPCPHHNACPLTGNDWCHFSVRLQRQEYHRRLKGVSLGYEDEKYSYLILSKESVTPPKARVIRPPRSLPGRQIFDLCTANGVLRKTLTKKDGPAFKAAKHLRLGDAWNDDSGS